MMRRALWLLFLVLLSCADPEVNTQIVISVVTDYEVPADLSAVHFFVETVDGSKVRFDHLERLKSKRDLPLTLALTSIHKGKPVVRVTITGKLAGDSVVRREAVVSFRAGQTLSLPMNLLRVCRDQLCVAGETSCAESGRCETVERDDLAPWPGDAPGLDANGPIADASTTGPRADSSVDGGGDMDASTRDGGVRDASTRDGGVRDGGVDGGGTDGGMPMDPNIVALSAGFYHSCAVLKSGRVYCWGGDTRLALGSDSTLQDCPDHVCVTPRVVPGVSNAVQVVTGERFSCALTAQGEVWCWGANYHGQIGAAVGDDPMLPTRVRFRAMPGGTTPLLSGIDRIVAGRSFACARVAASKALVCWGGGANEYSQVPTARTDLNAAVPTDLTSDVQAVALGHFHGCFISGAGALSCWGSNSDAQLGVAPATMDESRLAPFTVFASGVTAVAGGDAHTCAIVSGAVRCFGLAGAGQLGFGPVPSGLPECSYGVCTPPLDVAEAPGLSPPTSLALGSRLSCARYSDGRVACWGSNEDRATGQAIGAAYDVPTFVPNLTGARIIAAGYGHACAATADEIFCWGANDEGQLGPTATVGTSSAELHRVTIVEAP